MVDPGNILYKIQLPEYVFRDIVRNRWWIYGSLAAIAAWTVTSAVLFHWVEGAHHHKLSWISSFYFTVINITTVGFGDITPHTAWGKIIAMANSVVGVLSFGVAVSIISAALQPSGASVLPSYPQSYPFPSDLFRGPIQAPMDRETMSRFVSSFLKATENQGMARRRRLRIVLKEYDGSGSEEAVLDISFRRTRRRG